MKAWIIMTSVVISVKEVLLDLLLMFLEFYGFDVDSLSDVILNTKGDENKI